MTQAQVAAEIGIARESYTNIENGVRKPSVKVAMRLGAVLGFDWVEIYADDDDQQGGCTP
ncbi:MAG: helix-turn-helix transcriptional regulator [Oscillospiraceae bacterium]|nr:helix-turn-helix transcriptional regulator [Oscillospiraceae bacterium]